MILSTAEGCVAGVPPSAEKKETRRTNNSNNAAREEGGSEGIEAIDVNQNNQNKDAALSMLDVLTTLKAYRLFVSLCQGLIAIAEGEGCVEKNRGLLTDALNYAYQAKSHTARFYFAKPTELLPVDVAHQVHALKQAYLTSSYLVCNTLSVLGQHRKASLMAESLLDSLASAAAASTRRGGNDDGGCDPNLDALVVETQALYANCLAKMNDPVGSRDMCSKAEEGIAVFRNKWFETTRHHRLSTAASSGDSTTFSVVTDKHVQGLTQLQLGTLILETWRRLERGAAIQICMIRGETHASQKRWEDALVHFSQAFDLSQRSQQPMIEVAALQCLGRCYRELDQTQMAVGYARQAVAVAKESADPQRHQVLWYRASTFLADFLCALDRRSEAGELWEEILTLAQKFGDHEVERSTTKNMITILLRGDQYYEAITASEALERTCLAQKEGGTSCSKDRLFALEKLAISHIAVGEIKKALEVIDRMEMLEDADLAAHDTANQLRSQALLAQREDHAAIDVIVEWKHRAEVQGNSNELLKATFALAEALVNVSLSDAKNEYSAVLTLCSQLHAQLRGPDELLSCEQRELGMRAARWLSHAFHLNDDVLEVEEILPEEEETQEVVAVLGDPHSTGDSDPDADHLPAQFLGTHGRDDANLHDLGGDEDDGTAALQSAGQSSYGADDFVFDHDEDPEVSIGVHDAVSGDDVHRHTNESGCKQQQQQRAFSHDDMTRNIIEERCDYLQQQTAMRGDEHQHYQHHNSTNEPMVSLVRCYNPQLAIEVMEAAMRLLSPHGVLPIYRSPKTVVDICLSSMPNATFVFYLLDYATPCNTASSPGGFGGGGSPPSLMSSSAAWVPQTFQYDVVVRPAGTPFLYTKTVSVDAPLADYHRRRFTMMMMQQGSGGGSSATGQGGGVKKGGSSSSSNNFTAAESDGTEYLYACLRALHDALWEPVARVSSTASLMHRSDCVVVVPHPSLLHVPFGALVSPKRKAVGQRACVIVSPSLSHLAFHTAGRDDDGVLTLPRRVGSFASWLVPDEETIMRDAADAALPRQKFEKILFLNSETTALPTTNSGGSISTTSGSSSSFFAVPRQHNGGRGDSGGGALGDLKRCIHDMNISVVHGGTRKELLAAFASDTTRCIAVLSDSPPERSVFGEERGTASSSTSSSSSGVFRMADGDVHLSELTALRSVSSENLELVIVTNDRRHQPSIFDLGSAARLCTVFNCKRVLRVDVVGGGGVLSSLGGSSNSGGGCGITHQHVLMVQLFLYFVHVSIANGLRFPYVVALQAAQAEAIRQYALPPHIWGGVTLVGAP
jgi:tetratricopeptide (TPR) repeat protein